jgi:hypothetical protein
VSGDTALAERIASVLTAAGFTRYQYPRDDYGGKPTFVISDGVGATVSLHWARPEEDRAPVLAEYEDALRGGGLNVANHGLYLYVAEVQS